MQGVGKTVQVAALLGLLFHSGLARRALLLVPVSLTVQWESELRSWCPSIPVHLYSGAPARREKQRVACMKQGGILLSTFGLLASQQGSALFTSFSPPPSSPDADEWDALILDEGHRIKNPDTRLTRTVKRVACRFRLLLSGTPIQNDLHELWCLMDFACSGRLLGDRATFCRLFSEPIRNGSDRNASSAEKHRAQQLAQQLTRLIGPHMLRRDKKEVMRRQKEERQRLGCLSADGAASASSVSSSSASFLSVQKNELMVWVYLSEAQVRLYSAFICSAEVKAALNSTRSPLAALTVLKKICDHPRLLHQQMTQATHSGAHSSAQQQVEAEDEEDAGGDRRGDGGDEESVGEGAASSPLLQSLDPLLLLSESHKLRVLLSLLEGHRSSGHRTLVFSQSVKMLDIIAAALTAVQPPFTFLRIDGSIRKAEDRQRRIDDFSSPSSPHSLMLLTTGVGGVGLNLTAADRCVIFDPSWNPAVDSQSVDRCYRIGQTRHVVVYRFITCGTVEEVIYRKQIFKQGLFRAIQQRNHTYSSRGRQEEAEAEEKAVDMEEDEGDEGEQLMGPSAASTRSAVRPRGYFTRQELREVFSLRDHRHSVTQRQLAQQHPPHQRQSYPQLELHIQHLQRQHSQHIFGISDHDLLFQHTPPHNPPHAQDAHDDGAETDSHRRPPDDPPDDDAEAQRAKAQALHARERLLACPVVVSPSAPLLSRSTSPSSPPSNLHEADWREEERRQERFEELTATWTLSKEEKEEEERDYQLLLQQPQRLNKREAQAEEEHEQENVKDGGGRRPSVPSAVVATRDESADVEPPSQRAQVEAARSTTRTTEEEREEEGPVGEERAADEPGQADFSEADAAVDCPRLSPHNRRSRSFSSEAGEPFAHPNQQLLACARPVRPVSGPADSSDDGLSWAECQPAGSSIAESEEAAPTVRSSLRPVRCCHPPASVLPTAGDLRCVTRCLLCLTAEEREVRASHLRAARRAMQQRPAEQQPDTGVGGREADDDEKEEEEEWTASSASLLSLPLPAALRVLDCLLSALSICDASAALQAAILLLHAHARQQLQHRTAPQHTETPHPLLAAGGDADPEINATLLHTTEWRRQGESNGIGGSLRSLP